MKEDDCQFLSHFNKLNQQTIFFNNLIKENNQKKENQFMNESTDSLIDKFHNKPFKAEETKNHLNHIKLQMQESLVKRNNTVLYLEKKLKEMKEDYRSTVTRLKKFHDKHINSLIDKLILEKKRINN